MAEAATANQWYGTGRRKAARARVFIRPGGGDIQVNKKPLNSFLPNPVLQMTVRHPLVTTENGEKFDVMVNVNGGGPTGQAGAIRLGIARALLRYDIELKKHLRSEGLLTRDARTKERKKYGQPGARKRFQFSKR